MPDKTIHFVAGLPRSGSTLLCNVLNQNPLFHATPTSGIIEIMLAIRNQWDNTVFFKAAPNPVGKEAVLKGILQNYYATVDKPIIFDKNRGWLSYIEMLEFVLDTPVKIICTVRDIVDVIASFEKLYRKHTHIWQFPQEKSNFSKWQTVEDRAGVWMDAEQPIGIAYNRLRDAFSRGHGDKIHLVEFDALTRTPDIAMKGIYDFLGMEYFSHDFNNVKQTTFEDDIEHGIPGLHDIRSKIESVESTAKEILGDDVMKRFGDAEFWR